MSGSCVEVQSLYKLVRLADNDDQLPCLPGRVRKRRTETTEAAALLPHHVPRVCGTTGDGNDADVPRML